MPSKTTIIIATFLLLLALVAINVEFILWLSIVKSTFKAWTIAKDCGLAVSIYFLLQSIAHGCWGLSYAEDQSENFVPGRDREQDEIHLKTSKHFNLQAARGLAGLFCLVLTFIIASFI